MSAALQKIIARSHTDRESWRYTDLEALLAQKERVSLARACVGEGGARRLGDGRVRAGETSNTASLIFRNGIFQPKQSRFGAVPSCILMGDGDSGYELTLGEHTCLVAQPIDMHFITDENAPQDITIKLAIDIGANGRLTLLEHHHGPNTVTIVDCAINLQERAKFVHGKILSNTAHLATTNVAIAAGAYYNNFALVRGGVPVRNEITVGLNGRAAQASLCGAMLLCDAQHADTTITIQHNAPDCASRQMYKTVLADKSRGVFQGKIYVAPDAQKTDGYQLSRALLLSDQAEMDAKPELEIYADDVKCSHGSTIGDLDENAMFYLRARGLNEAEARALLIDAFIGELFDDLTVEEWRAVFRAEMEGWPS